MMNTNTHPRYSVTIKYPSGHVLQAVVTKERLREFHIRACKGASIKILKVQQ